MMSSKTTILSSIRRHTTEKFTYPDLKPLKHEALTYADPIAAFSKHLEQAGGRAIVLKENETVGDVVARLYPKVQRVANTISTLSGAEALPGKVFNPDDADEPAQLNGTDVAIIESQVGVAENACCWIEQQVRYRAIYFIAEALVIVLHKTDVVNNMHEAYSRIANKSDVPFACFISGPSKTADIEQALVFGAHGAKEVTVVLI